MSVGPGWKMYGWVPDGIYDYSGYLIRYILIDGMPTHVVTKMWIEKGLPDDSLEELKKPWGTYPDFPPKPEKK